MGRGTEINFHLIGSTPPITDTSYNTSTKTWRPQMPISLTGFHTRVLGAPTFTLTGKIKPISYNIRRQPWHLKAVTLLLISLFHLERDHQWHKFKLKTSVSPHSAWCFVAALAPCVCMMPKHLQVPDSRLNSCSCCYQRISAHWVLFLKPNQDAPVLQKLVF